MDTTIESCLYELVFVSNFTLNKQCWVFWQNLLKKSFPSSKIEKVKTTTEFCIFKLVQVPNFSSNWEILFFQANLPKKGISGQKEIPSPWNTAYMN